MKVTVECLPCLDRLIAMTVEAASPDPMLRERASTAAREFVLSMQGETLSAAHLANRFYPLIQSICGNPDPLSERKRREMDVAFGFAREYAPAESASFRELIGFSGLGNAIDFFRPAEAMEAQLRQGASFAVDEVARLEARLGSDCRSILWLADNAGEAFFDLPVLQRLTEAGLRVLYAVKGGPVQNDVTLQDLQNWLEREAAAWRGIEVIDTGVATVGLELDKTSTTFRRAFDSADVIVAKGMGHYETLDGFGDPRLFFLLMAKCHPVSRALGAPVGGLAAFFAPNDACSDNS